MPTDINFFNSIQNKRMKLLISFINSDMTVDDFLGKDRPPFEEFKKFSKIVSESELLSCKEHELFHKKVWDKYNVKTEFKLDFQNKCLTIDTNFDVVIKRKGYDKNRVIEIMKEVVYEPYKYTKDFNGCTSDLYLYEILSRNLKSWPPTEINSENLMRKYKYPI